MINGPHGYHGSYLRVNLTTQTFTSVEIPHVAYRQFIGGSGLGTWILLRETAGRELSLESTPPLTSHVGDDSLDSGRSSVVGYDPLSPAAPLIFVFSPLVGSPLTTSAKFAVLAKSPLTQRINDSLSSSHFALAGKRTGCDAIVIVGRAEHPTAIVVTPQQVLFEDAADLWGQSSSVAQQCVRQRLGTAFRTAAIGPAGENLVRYATVSNDGRHAGRGGHGAVMGSKRLKLIAVAGDRLTSYASPTDLVAYSRELSRRSFGPATEKYRELGTVSNLLTFNRLGTLPTRNFQSGHFDNAPRLAPETIARTHPRTRDSCAACTIGCEHVFQMPGTGQGVRMEYENLFALGPLCGVSDPDAVLAASQLCDDLGLDTISCGGTIAFAMECAERGLIDAPELRFGNAENLIDLIHAIGMRRGLGDLLAEGTRIAAGRIGSGAEQFAVHVKGLELPGYEPRALQTMALGFAVGTRGADHNRSGAYQVDFSNHVDRMAIDGDAVPYAIATENEACLMDSLILCKFLRGVLTNQLDDMSHMLRLVTGFDMSAEELVATAGSIITARKVFNIRQGWTPAEDTLPRRFLDQPLPDGASQGATLTESRLDELITAYNLQRGWSADGWVSENQTDQVLHSVAR